MMQRIRRESRETHGRIVDNAVQELGKLSRDAKENDTGAVLKIAKKMYDELMVCRKTMLERLNFEMDQIHKLSGQHIILDTHSVTFEEVLKEIDTALIADKSAPLAVPVEEEKEP